MNTLDLYNLHLVRLVAKYRNFTAAAKEANLSQSALTRQVKKAEDSLGFSIFYRTTRAVTITEPGAILLRETKIIPNILENTLRRINEEYLNQQPEIKIGISTEISHSHIPGLFDRQVRNNKETRIIISQASEPTLEKELQANQIDIAFLTYHTDINNDLTILQWKLRAPTHWRQPKGAKA